MEASSLTSRASSEGWTWSLDSAATSWTTFASIGMAQLREGGKDLLRSRAPEFDRELRALPMAFARDHDALPELGVAHMDPDRTRSGATPTAGATNPAWLPRGGRGGEPGLALHPLETVFGDLVEETRRASRARIPRAPVGGMEEMDPELRAGECHIEKPPLLLDLGGIVDRRGVGKKTLLEAHHEDDREFEPLRGVDRHEIHRIPFVVPEVHVGQERHFGEETIDGRVLRASQVGLRARDQLVDVLDPLAGLHGILLGQILPVADLRYQLGQPRGRGERRHGLERREEAGHPSQPLRRRRSGRGTEIRVLERVRDREPALLRERP